MFRNHRIQCVLALFLALVAVDAAKAGEVNPLRDSMRQDDNNRISFPEQGIVRHASFVTFQDNQTESVLNEPEQVDPLRIDDQSTVDANQTELEGEVIDSGIVVGETVLGEEAVSGDCASGLCGSRLGICADGC